MRRSALMPRAGLWPAVALLSVCLSVPVTARELTLEEALDIALNRTGRGEIIKGNLDVAEETYFAEKINFYLPEISINGSLPSYGVSERWGYLPGTDGKSAVSEPYLDFDADITLTQNLITGGDLTVRADLTRQDREHPDRDGNPVDEFSRLGRFNVEFTQPILKPSDPKFELANKRDDLDIARLTRVEESAALQREVIECFFGVLQTDLQSEIAHDQYEGACLKGAIDSIKLQDGVVSDGDWLETASARLDAELAQFEADSEAAEQKRLLMGLLDIDAAEPVTPVVPKLGLSLSGQEQQRLANRWRESIPIVKARHEYDKTKRQADYTASSHGLSGTISANYNPVRGRVEDAGLSEDLMTDSWGVKLELSYPLWDGGASGASVRAARLSAEQARLEYDDAEKSARAEVANLINKLNVSYRKLEVLKKQIGLAGSRLDIARSRLDDGQISMLTFLGSRVSYYETRNNYLEELKGYFNYKVDLECRYAN